MFLALPLSLVFTVAFGLVLFVIGSVYGVAGLISLDVDPGADEYRRFFALHVVYGVTLGVVLGIWWVVQPMVM